MFPFLVKSSIAANVYDPELGERDDRRLMAVRRVYWGIRGVRSFKMPLQRKQAPNENV